MLQGIIPLFCLHLWYYKCINVSLGINTHTMNISPYVYVGLQNTNITHSCPEILFDRLLQMVSTDFNMSCEQLLSRRRWRDCIYARQIMSYILRIHYRMKVTSIGRLMGNRDHSTILHSTKQHYNDYECSAEYREICDRILRKLGVL